MIIRFNEYCPHCGQQDPWRKHGPHGQEGRSYVASGERRMTVFCRRCGARDMIRYVEKPKN